MKKTLVLVLSSENEPYKKLRAIQRSTWAAVPHAHVTTLFYRGICASPPEPETLDLNCSDAYDTLHWKTKLAFDHALTLPWDFLLRTNASSYVCKHRLAELVQALPEERVYGGTLGQITNFKGLLHVGGAGILMSRDVVKILVNELKPESTPYNDDGEFAVILSRHGILGEQINGRHDVFFRSRKLPDTWMYRCKSDDSNRDKDILAMNRIHRKKRKWLKL